MPAISAPTTIASSQLITASEIANKFLSLQVETLALIVPIEAVYRILSNIEIHNTGNLGYGIAHLDEKEISVLNLHHHLFQREFPHPSGSRKDCMVARYVVTIQSQSGELFGIPVDRAPTLVDVPVSEIRKLPDAYRQVDTLGIASHVAVIQDAGQPTTVFLLDLEGFMALIHA